MKINSQEGKVLAIKILEMYLAAQEAFILNGLEPHAPNYAADERQKLYTEVNRLRKEIDNTFGGIRS